MFYCLDPYPLSKPGDGRAYNPQQNAVDFASVACGRCASCVKNRKQAWAGKLVAESLTSKSVSFVTLTYAKDPEGVFRYSDVQTFLDSLRRWAWRQHEARVRFFCIGENGEEKGRVHWHLILFFDKPVRLPVPAMNAKLSWWDHGWANVQNLTSPEAIAHKARYCVGYAVKDVGGKGQRPRCSLKPALGSEWLMRHAHDTAKAALCPNGLYTLPGMVWSRGPKAGQSQPFKVRGSQIRHYIKQWHSSWSACWPNLDAPTNDWLQHYDEDAVSPVFTMRSNSRWLRDTVGRNRAPTIAVRERTLPPPDNGPYSGNYWSTKVIVSPDGWSCELAVCYAGPDRWRAYIDADGTFHDIDASISEVLDLAPQDVVRLDKWIKLQRGPDWSPVHGEAKREERRRQRELRAQSKAAFRDFIRQHAAAVLSAERAKTGVTLSRKDDSRNSSRALQIGAFPVRRA